MMDVVLHVADPPFTAKLRAKPQRPLAAVAAAFCKAFQKKHGVALERYELRVDGAALPADALVEALAGRAAELVPSSSTAAPSSSTARPPTSSGAPLAPRPPGSSRVVAFLASHVGQASRLESLDACLESVERQRSAPARLLVPGRRRDVVDGGREWQNEGSLSSSGKCDGQRGEGRVSRRLLERVDRGHLVSPTTIAARARVPGRHPRSRPASSSLPGDLWRLLSGRHASRAIVR